MFTKNRERLQEGDVFEKFMTMLLKHEKVKPLCLRSARLNSIRLGDC